ncbi:hypothetical protein TRAPUB_8462 [Trametes pubescens]|uniref:Uncharacterized protein n=1 Tax=Trametes pubescens TaxID=154538 RepID=A0A1M2W580_TRAPU|nr:hypothetical protein TRAPUB_8462 [Trametes pubescens]
MNVVRILERSLNVDGYADTYNQNPGFSQALVVRPAGGDALVNTQLLAIYYIHGVEALQAAADTYCTDMTWVLKGSWENTTGSTQSYTYQHTTELKVTQGSEVTTGGVPLVASFKDLTMTVGSKTKTFSANETTTPQTKAVTVEAAPGKKVMFYQRQYNFRTEMFFVMDAASVARNVAAVSGDGLSRKTCVVEIMSGDYLVTEKELINAEPGTVQPHTYPRANKESDRGTVPRSGLTTRARDALNLIGA